MTLEHLSHSALEDYKNCGEKFRLGRVVKFPKTPGWSLIGGLAVHMVTETLDNRDFGIEMAQADNFLDAFEVLRLEQLEKDGCPPESEWYRAGRPSKANPNKEDKAWWLNNGPSMIESYKSWRKVAPWDIWLTPDGEPAIELGGTSVIGGVPFQFHIDRVMEDRETRQLCVVDIKSGSRIPDGQQCGEYAVSLTQVLRLDRPIIWGAYWMARTGTLTAPEDLSRFYDGRLEYEVGSVWESAQRGSYGPARPGNLCGSCSVARGCYSRSYGVAADVLPFPKLK